MSSENLPKLIVTIIDRDTTRRDGMRDAFKDIADVQYGYQGFRADAHKTDLKEFAPSLLTLRHVRDSKFDPDLETGLTVYYSGNGGNDKDYPKGAKRIWRAISSNVTVLTKTEARQLIQFIEEFQTNQQVAEPDFLHPPQTISNISALAVLCQSYLAVYAAHFLKEDDEENARRLIEKLLRHSDEQAQKSLKLLLTPTLATRLPQVSSPLFWRKPFLTLDGGETPDGFNVKLFSKKVDDERKKLNINNSDFEIIKKLTPLFGLPESERSVAAPVEKSSVWLENKAETLSAVENAYQILAKVLNGREAE